MALCRKLLQEGASILYNAGEINTSKHERSSGIGTKHENETK